MKKLIPAFALLLVSAVLMSTASFAWFSMNNTVTVTGMEIRTAVNDNLFIASSSAGNDKAADSAFVNGVHQVVSGDLQPVSTISAVDTAFYTTQDAKPDGSKLSDKAVVPYTLVTGNDIVINTTHYKAYVDYVVELKAINSSDADKYVNLSKVNLLYKGASTDVTHAWRVAVFVQPQADTSATLATSAVTDAYAAINTTAANTILAPTGFTYFTPNNAVSGPSALAAVTPVVNNDGWTSDAITPGATQYYKVTVRLWLEGEDTDCYSTKFVTLTDEWQLDLKFTLDSSDTAAALIGSTANATNTLSGTTFTAALTNGENAASYEWFKVGTAGAISGATASTYDAATSGTGSYYAVITTTDGNKYMTPVVAVTVGP